jgi:hypothetical protein
VKKPVPDGLITVYLNNGTAANISYRAIVLMRKEPVGFRIVSKDDVGARHVRFYPWTSILYMDNMINSDRYVREYEAWKEYETAQATIENRTPEFACEHYCCYSCGEVFETVIADNVRDPRREH